MPGTAEALFDPACPFPLLPEGALTYAQAQAHSEAVDRWLGLLTEETERAIARSLASGAPAAHQQLWVGTPTRTFLTPYTEIREILEKLRPPPGSLLIDLGAGYGRLGFVIGAHYPDLRFLGYEYVPERVWEARRCLTPLAYSNVRMEVADLSVPGFRPEPADYYFIYDYGTRQAIEKTLEDLRVIAQARPITVVARGRGSRDSIERGCPWLSQVVVPENFAHYSIYRSA